MQSLIKILCIIGGIILFSNLFIFIAGFYGYNFTDYSAYFFWFISLGVLAVLVPTNPDNVFKLN